MQTSFNQVLLPLKMGCPACGLELGDLPESQAEALICPGCTFKMSWDGACWDACADRSYPRSFSRQWSLWEAGKLGNPNLVYGYDPKYYFREFLAATSLTEEQLKSMKILEIGFGHGRLLRQLQERSNAAYGIDLSRPLKSAQLRPGSAFFGNLLAMPFVPGQFDLVLCRGIIHHTPNPQESFAFAAQQVAKNGMLYLGGHYEPAMKLSFLLRRTFPWSWRYPEFLSLGLSSILSIVRSTMEAVRTRNFGAEKFKTSYAHYKLNMFDILAPRWATEHPEDEVKTWFLSQGMSVRRYAPGEYVGVKLSPSVDQSTQLTSKRVAEIDPTLRTA